MLKGFNDLATTQPEIASEWSEKNLPFKPDAVNAKSRENVWWKCSKCGNEWKSVINARVKGTVCPVCAEKEVLAGYNDLATTDKEFLDEWDYEQNRLKPTEVSRNSAKRAWWKCKYGHSWKMKGLYLVKVVGFVRKNIYQSFRHWRSAIMQIRKV